jgi:hypothetical protein
LEELNIVDEKNINRGTVESFEFIDRLVPQTVDDFVDERFGGDALNAKMFVVLSDVVANAMEQVGLSKTDPAVQEEGVICIAWAIRNADGGGFDELIRTTFNKGLESIVAIQLGFKDSGFLFFSRVNDSNGRSGWCKEGFGLSFLFFDDELNVRFT